MYVLNIEQETNRILSAGIMLKPPIGAVSVEELPKGNLNEYLYINGNFVHDPLPEPEPIEPRQTTEDLLLEIVADHEYRICLMELGINESEVA